MARWAEPRSRLADDQVELRLPVLSDAAVLHAYACAAGGLEGVWVPLEPGASLAKCEALIGDWQAGWANLRSVQGPALVIVEADGTQLTGQVGCRDRGGRVVELVYGVAPAHRGRGYASRAAGLVAHWLLAERLAREVELRIGRGHIESQRVAVAAGFVPAGSIVSHVEGTGETYDDLRFVRADVELRTGRSNQARKSVARSAMRGGTRPPRASGDDGRDRTSRSWRR